MIASITEHLNDFEKPKRKALSSRFPALKGPSTLARRMLRSMKNKATLKRLTREPYLPCVVARHSSLLFRKLGDSDMALQRNKVTNLKAAIPRLAGLVIPPGETFSLWEALGHVRRSKGYVDGMLLSNGTVSAGLGGGLCQLSNFLFWIFLHAEVEIVERHHHSVDVFPDSGRTLPFGSGATIFDNYLDLKIRNISKHSLQIKLWLTDLCLKGQILSEAPAEKKFHIVERNHCFVKRGDRYFRYNELYRETFVKGVLQNEERILTNFAPVSYQVSEEYIAKNGFTVVSV